MKVKKWSLREEISDLRCRSAGQKCGTGMVFDSVAKFVAELSSDEFVGCIQLRKCIGKWPS